MIIFTIIFKKGWDMAKTQTPVTENKQSETLDYFRLPFEVYYSECVNVTQYEFKSDIEVNRFADVKAVHMDQGRAWGSLFKCEQNEGPELYCCLTNSHDEVEPTWLGCIDEDNMNFNYGCDYVVQVDGDEITFISLSDEEEDEDSDEFLNVDEMDYCCSYTFMAYQIGEAHPDYIILDANGSRVKIDLEGYKLDEEGSRITSLRIINVDNLNRENYQNYGTSKLFDAKYEWVKSILEKDFPQDKNLSLSRETE
jgi:hypothetical protein